MRSVLGPPAAGGFRRTTCGTPGLNSRSRGAGLPSDYPDVPDKSSSKSAALAVDAEEEISSMLWSELSISGLIRTSALVGVGPDRLLPRPSSDTKLLSELSVLVFAGCWFSFEMRTRLEDS